MQEKVEHLFAQKSQRPNKLPLPLLFNVDFNVRIFAINIFNNFISYI